MQPTDPWLSRYAKLVVGVTFFLIFLGGMVTSKDAGLSVPDWPTSYGYSMFTFPISRWIGGVFFEHTHRLTATVVGLLTTLLVSWIWRNRWAFPGAFLLSGAATGAAAFTLARMQYADHETRGLIVMHVNIWSFALAFAVLLMATDRARRLAAPWLRWLSFGAFLLVCVQGTLGGLRVTEVSIVLAMIHACTAQLFLALLVIIASALSPWWNRAPAEGPARALPAIRVLGWVMVGAVYLQLMIGAVMRHLHAGLAIPTFPLAFGQWIPPMINERVAIHFAHRVGALVVTLVAIVLCACVFAGAQRSWRLAGPAWHLMAFIALQIALGASIIWTAREPVITSLHVVNGAAVLATALWLALRATRLKLNQRPESRSWEEARLQEAHA